MDRVGTSFRPQWRRCLAISWFSKTSFTSSTVATTVILRWAYFTGTLYRFVSNCTSDRELASACATRLASHSWAGSGRKAARSSAEKHLLRAVLAPELPLEVSCSAPIWNLRGDGLAYPFPRRIPSHDPATQAAPGPRRSPSASEIPSTGW